MQCKMPQWFRKWIWQPLDVVGRIHTAIVIFVWIGLWAFFNQYQVPMSPALSGLYILGTAILALIGLIGTEAWLFKKKLRTTSPLRIEFQTTMLLRREDDFFRTGQDDRQCFFVDVCNVDQTRDVTNVRVEMEQLEAVTSPIASAIVPPSSLLPHHVRLRFQDGSTQMDLASGQRERLEVLSFNNGIMKSQGLRIGSDTNEFYHHDLIYRMTLKATASKCPSISADFHVGVQDGVLRMQQVNHDAIKS